MSVNRKHIPVLDFYSIFYSLRLYFTDTVLFGSKYGLYSEQIKGYYNSDDCHRFYDNAAISIKNRKTAILKTLSHLATDNGKHIVGFNPNITTNLEIYHNNKQKLIDDFKELIYHDLIQELITGRLYTKIQTNKINVELIGYINAFYPIVSLAKTYSKQDTYLRIIESIDKKSVEAENFSIKISKVICRYIEKDSEFNLKMKNEISKIIFDKITEITELRNQTETTEEEDIHYGNFYC